MEENTCNPQSQNIKVKSNAIIKVDISEAKLHRIPDKTDFAFNRKSSV
jgi:hypothetical protein